MPALTEVPKRRTLQSWKEIAAYLDVTVRSVQRWEKESGLPVYRQGSGIKARVFAYSDEIQKWQESGGFDRRQEETVASSFQKRWLIYIVRLGIAVLVVVAGFILWQSGIFPRTRIPHSWQVDGSVLKILDAGDHLCWEKRFPAFDIEFDSGVLDKALIADIDDDGSLEVLFNFLPDNLGANGGSLMCFEQNGRLRWEFHYGSPKTFGTRTFEPSYRGRIVRLVRIEGKPVILTVANHYIWYPSQAALLDPETGHVLEEYWHPGWVYLCALHDIDHDGTDEVLLAAINNPGDGLGHAALSVLKLPFSKAPRRAFAANDPFPPMTGGGELAYFLFPLPDVCRVYGYLPIVARLTVDAYSRILVETPVPEAGGIVYYFDFNLKPVEYRLSDNFAPLHERCYRQRLLNHPLSGEEKTSLGKVVPFSAAPDGNSPSLKQFWKF